LHSVFKLAPLPLLIGALVSGCVVGPNFKAPAAPQSSSGAEVHSYTADQMPNTTAATTTHGAGNAGAAQHIVYGADIPAQWWTLFHSPELDQLIKSALQQNPTVQSAEASLRQAEENYNAQSGSLTYPNVTGQLGANRQRSAQGGTSPSVFNLYNASVNVSYTLDIFGANQRQLEGMTAAVDYQRYVVEAAYQTLIANVVTTAIKEASLRAQLKATRDVLNAQQSQLDITQKQLALGGVTKVVELTQSTQVAQTQALIAPLEKALAQTRHQLSVYVGKLPSESGLPQFELSSLQLPADLPISVPSALVRQRPDIRASEALLHQASAQIGVATANQYPQITLSGSYGVDRLDLGQLSATSTLWSLGAGLTQPIFNAGALSAKRRAAQAGYEQATAQYRSTVLTAFQNVADSLRAIQSDADSLKAQAQAAQLAQANLDLVTQQYRMGAVSYLVLLDAQRSYQQTQVSVVQAQAARFTDTAALYQALGGGWWNQPTAPASAQQ
jgi:NodT family efflux transporter outer membrane factor (OMF) lipoprotein